MKRIIFLLVLLIPFGIQAVTLEEYNEALARVSESAAGNYSEEWVYSYFWGGTPENPVSKKSEIRERRDKAYAGQKTSGYIYGTMSTKACTCGRFENKFSVYCETFVQVMVYHTTNGAVSYSSDYQKIKVSEMKRGDLIHFPAHIAVYLGPGEGKTYRVAQASRGVAIADESRTPDYAWRIKSSSLSKIDYNYLTSSYDFHDRLDDYAPIIKDVSLIPNSNKVKISATDYKHYDLTPPNDDIEPENNGIVEYQITTTSTTPTTFKKVDRNQVLEVVEEVQKSGTYYIWVKDVGGNITSKAVNLTNVVVDEKKPNVGSINANIFRTSIFVSVVGASDESGIKEYRYYLNDKLVEATNDAEYYFENLIENAKYNFYYEVVDQNGNVSKSQVYTFETTINAKNIVLTDTAVDLQLGETYKINPKVEIDDGNYSIKYTSSNTSVATVTNDGVVKGISPGSAIIKITVGNKEASLSVVVLKYNIIFLTSNLPTAYVDKDYHVDIKTNPSGIINFAGGTLPNGLRVENNAIVGKPTSLALGKYTFTLTANVDGEIKIAEYTIYVNKQDSFNYIWLLLIVPIGLIAYLFINKIKKNKTYV